MQDLRDLQCLIALARHKHFAHAAEQCGLSQPAFSMRIRALEERLNTRIVKRGNRFQGLTPEGQTVLDHAKRITAQVQMMEQEVKATPGELVGSLTIGVIPTAGAYSAKIAKRLYAAHPGIRTRLETASSLDIQQGVSDGRFDCGITYTEGLAPELMHNAPLYHESYVILVPEEFDTGPGDQMSWRQSAIYPLILLETDMQNRRIIDRVYREVGQFPRVVAETSGFMAAVLMAAEGLGATIVPDVLWRAVGQFQGLVAFDLVDPVLEKSVSLVNKRSETVSPLFNALKSVAAQ